MDVLLVFLLPATLAGLGLMLARGGRGGAGRRGSGAARWAPLGVAVGLLVGYWGLLGVVPGIPPHDANGALFYVILGAGLVGWLEGRGGGKPAWRFARWGCVAVLAPWLYLKNLAKRWEWSEFAEHIGPIALAILLLTFGMGALARRRPGATTPLALWMAATGLALALLFTGFAINAELAGTLASVLGAAVVCSWIWPRASLAGGAAGVVAVTLATLAAGGIHLSELPPLSALLIVLAPLAAWLGDLLGARRMPPRRAVLLRLLLVAIPIVAGTWIAFEDRPAEAAADDPYADYY